MYTKNRSSVIVICFDRPQHSGARVRYSAPLITAAGVVGVKIGPTYNDGREFLPLDRILAEQAGEVSFLSRDDQSAIEAEVRRYGHRHIEHSLEEWGYLEPQGGVEKFNKVGPHENAVQHEFDHPGSLASGSRQKMRLRVGAYDHAFTDSWS